MNDIKTILKTFKLTIKSNQLLENRDLIVSFWNMYSQEEVLEINSFTALFNNKGPP